MNTELPDLSALRERVKTILATLEPHNTLNPPVGCWIETSEGGVEIGSGGGCDWCWEHGKEAVDRLNLYTPGATTYEAIPSDPCGNYDSLPRCAECGITLAGWPTDYCRSEELGYFESEPDFDASLENIHIITMVMWNLQWADGKEADAALAWLSVADRLLEKLRQEGTRQ